MRKIAIILNPNAGILGHLEEVRNYCTTLPKDEFDIYIQEETKDIEGCAEELARSYDVIIAAGGDGTVHSVASGILKAGHGAIGIVPLGTFNHLAMDLNIPLEVDDALDCAIKSGIEIKIDAVDCNGHTFLNNSSLGVYARLLHNKESYRSKGIPKWIAFAISTLQVLFNMPKIYVSLKVEGKELRHLTSFVFVGNNHYEIDEALGVRTSLCDGVLTIWTTRKSSTLGLLTLLYHLFFSKISSHKDFDVYYGDSVTVEAYTRSVQLSIDGEAIKLAPPLLYKILPRALSVIVPQIKIDNNTK